MTRAQLERSLSAVCAQVADPRAGILGPASAAWCLGGDVTVFLGGGRAALLQLAHPKVAHAIDHHSRTRSDVVGRFERTFQHVFAMLFGELDDALLAARRVHAIHARVHGSFPTQIGGWPAGTTYHANDADTLRWVHATLVDTTLLVRSLQGPPLPLSLLDRYVQDMNRFAALFGIPDELLPPDHAAHVAYMQRMLASDQLVVTPAARELAHFLVGRAAGTSLGRLVEATTAALLPPSLARAFELRPAPRLVRAWLATVYGVHRRLPAHVTWIPQHRNARDRLAGRQAPSRMATWMERRLFALAREIAA